MGSHEEIITDILSRLPVKSLLRFKCVSKFWNTSISDPYFKKKHLNIHAKSPKLLIGQSFGNGYYYLYSCPLLPSSKLVKDKRKLDYPSSFKPTHCRVYCCCDGLALIGIWSTMNVAEIPRLFLWNPSTGESILLPGHLEISPQDEYIYGLGYDATSDDYKILRVDVYDEIPDEILALKSGSWRKIEGRRSIPIISLRRLCLAFVHGAFHWLGTLPWALVSLNISNELYQEISLPKILLSTITRRSYSFEVGVSVLGGKLSIYINNDDVFCIWVLEDYGVKECWTKWFTLPNFSKVILGLDIIPIYKFSDDEVLVSYFNIEGIKYRTSNRSLEVSNRMSPLHCDDTDIEGIQDNLVYTESLISPKELTFQNSK